MHTEQQINQLLKSGDLDAAQKIVDSLDISSLHNVNILLHVAMVYRRLNDLNKAAEFSSRATSIEPDNKPLSIAYSNDLMKLGQIDAAEAVLDRIPKAQQHDKDVLLQRSKNLYQNKDFKSATRLLVGLVKQHPEFSVAHMELAHALLMDRKWRAGWQEYEWRYRLPKTRDMFPKFRMPHWDGSNNLPHILLIADQGYGDCFQFSRYIPLVAQRCHHVTLIRSEPIARLMDSISGVSSSYSKWEDTPLTSAYCTLSGLPRLFSTLPNTIPDSPGIVKANSKDVARWKTRLREPVNDVLLRVGIAWSGRMEFENNYLRAVPFKQLEVLLEIPGIQFYSLQVGPPSSQAKGKNITNLSTDLTDFSETAAAMEALDLIITSDTSIAHLAGALDRPTWVLLNYAPDWRWSPEGNTSPWYPTLRLFRQNQPHSWESVIDECKIILQEITTAEDPLSTLLSIMHRDNGKLPDSYM